MSDSHAVLPDSFASWVEQLLQHTDGHPVELEPFQRHIVHGFHEGTVTADELARVFDIPVDMVPARAPREVLRERFATLAAKPVPRPCWNCGGPGVRCCEFGRDR